MFPVFYRVALASALLLLAGLCSAQSAEEESYQPRSGDAWIDLHLADMNAYAARYPDSFADEMARYYSVPRQYAATLQAQPAWEAGDVFMACALAQILAQPCRKVVREWSRDHTEGWKGVRERLQPKPDPAINRELRKDIGETYERWSRPLAK